MKNELELKTKCFGVKAKKQVAKLMPRARSYKLIDKEFGLYVIKDKPGKIIAEIEAEPTIRHGLGKTGNCILKIRKTEKN